MPHNQSAECCNAQSGAPPSARACRRMACHQPLLKHPLADLARLPRPDHDPRCCASTRTLKVVVVVISATNGACQECRQGFCRRVHCQHSPQPKEHSLDASVTQEMAERAVARVCRGSSRNRKMWSASGRGGPNRAKLDRSCGHTQCGMSQAAFPREPQTVWSTSCANIGRSRTMCSRELAQVWSNPAQHWPNAGHFVQHGSYSGHVWSPRPG